MLRGALVPSALVGLLAAAIVVLLWGPGSIAGALLGFVVAIGFFASGMFVLSRLVRSANPGAFLAVAMAVYLGQILVLLLFIMAFKNAAWVDGRALGIVAGVITLAWQVFAFRALRSSRLPVYDEPSEDAGAPAEGDHQEATGAAGER